MTPSNGPSGSLLGFGNSVFSSIGHSSTDGLARSISFEGVMTVGIGFGKEFDVGFGVGIVSSI